MARLRTKLVQLRLLLWKNFLVRKRQSFVVVVEIIWPLILTLILAWVRSDRPGAWEPQSRAWPRAMPSAGYVPMLQTWACSTLFHHGKNNRSGSVDEGGFPDLSFTPAAAVTNVLQLLADPGIKWSRLGQIPADLVTLANRLNSANSQNITSLVNDVTNSFLTNVTAQSLVQQRLEQLFEKQLNLSVADAQTLATASIDWQQLATFVLQDSNATRQATENAEAFCESSMPAFYSLCMTAVKSNPLLIYAASALYGFNNGVLSSSFSASDLAEFFPQFISANNLTVANLRPVLCDATQFNQVVTLSNDANSTEYQQLLCSLSATQLTKLVYEMQTIIVQSSAGTGNGASQLSPLGLLGVNRFEQEQLQEDLTFLTEINAAVEKVDLRPIVDFLNYTVAHNGLYLSVSGVNQFLCASNLPNRSKHRDLGRSNRQALTELAGLVPVLRRQLQSGSAASAVDPETPAHASNNPSDKEEAQQTSGALTDNQLHGHYQQLTGRIITGAIRVLYAPNDTLANQIMEKVVEPLNELVLLLDSWNSTLFNLSSIWGGAVPGLKAAVNGSGVQNFMNRTCRATLGWQSGFRPLCGLYIFARRFFGLQPIIDEFDAQNLTGGTVFAENVVLDDVTSLGDSLLMFMDDLASNVSESVQAQSIFQGFRNESELEKQAERAFENQITPLAGIIFMNINENSTLDKLKHLRYKIRQNETLVPATTHNHRRLWRPGPCTWYWCMRYESGGFNFLQDMIFRAINEMATNSTELDRGAWLQPFPYPCYLKDKFARAIASTGPLMFVLGWILAVAMLIKNIVHEKEQRLKEVMKVMGLDNTIHWVAWFINSLIIMGIAGTLLSVILKVGNILMYSDLFIIWIYTMIFIVSVINFSFLVSIFFARANLAACCGGLIFFACYLPYIALYIKQEEITFWQQALASLLAPTAFGLSAQYMSYYEQQAIGLQWDSLSTSPITGDNFNFLICMYFLIFDSFLYAILVWYLDNVMPGQYGIPKKWYFPFTLSYWFGDDWVARRRLRSNTSQASGILRGTDDMASPDVGSVPAPVHTSLKSEEEPTHLTCGVSIHNLVKTYDGAAGRTKLAVDKLSLNFYEGQITSFLGHNGAGKTTTMSVLTGIFPPTSGTAFVYGQDIRTDITKIRQSLGMCPQHNVLFDRLTVEEHMIFYAQVKGMRRSEVMKELDGWLSDVGLLTKRKALAKELSGGMKRKLSVAIAFVGGSKTVILDEPTAGVDPYARRGIWDLLVRYRNKGRTIILSTHHMDEADLLGDRIAIISHGKLRCIGSSLFLKSEFGEGYTLTIAKKPVEDSSTDSTPRRSPELSRQPYKGIADVNIDQQSDEGVSSDMSSASSDASLPGNLPHGRGVCSENVVTAVVKGFLPKASLLEDIGAEMAYNLPGSGAHDGSFAKLFDYLDSNLADLGIASYGISDTTLEEVFLKVSADGTSDDNDLGNDDGFFASVRRVAFKRRRKNGEAHHDVLAEIEQEGSINLSPDTVSLSSTADDTAPLVTEKAREQLEEADGGVIQPVNMASGGSGSHKITGPILLWVQFYALFIKRFHHARRNRKGFLAQVILPAVFVALAMFFKMLSNTPASLPPLLLVPSAYTEDKYIPIQTVPGGTPKDRAILASFKHPCGVSTEHFYDEDLSLSACFDYKANNYAQTYISSYRHNTMRFHNVTLSARAVKANVIREECNNNQMCTAYGAWCADLPRIIAQHKVVGGGILQELGDTTMDSALMNSRIYYRWKRWGAVTTGGVYTNSIAESKAQYPYTFINRLSVRRAARAWVNHQGYHSAPIYLSMLNNAILRSSLPSKENPTEWGVSIYSQPFNKTVLQLEANYRRSGIDVLIAVCIIFALSFVPASFVLFLIKERTSNAKHLQRLSGVSGTMYWLGSFAWDLCNYSITCIVCIFIFLIFDQKTYTSAESFPAVIALFLFYGWSITPIMYPATFFFNVPSTAYVFLVCTNILVGVFGTLATFILQLFPDDPELTHVNEVLRVFFLIFPNYALGRGLIDLAYQYYLRLLNQTVGGAFIPYQTPWGFGLDQIGRNITAMAITGVAYFLLNLAIEVGLFTYFIRRLKNRIPGLKTGGGLSKEDVEMDDDVARERRRVLSGRAADDTVVLQNFTKVYGTGKRRNRAVDRLCLGVPKGECFGLLGVNGAGKTSTFKMLTGEETVTAGDAFLNKLSVVTDKLQVQEQMGYCPQFDALDDLLSGRDHLMLYARLRGVPEEECAQVVNWAMDRLSLTRYANKSAGSYSGGNKRKLSTAMALIGKPPVIFLDEPTTGMDPGARRFLWTIVSGLARSGHCIILTSHSMEECEALCQRLAIMVNGRFQCLGSPQHLKDKFGNGYMVTIRMKGIHPDLSQVKEFIESTFQGATLQGEHHNMIEYQLASANLSLSRVFHEFSAVRDRLDIEDYSVSQTTLDQVFIGFAQKQTSGDEDDVVEENHRGVHVVNNPTTIMGAAFDGSGVHLVYSNMREEHI